MIDDIMTLPTAPSGTWEDLTANERAWIESRRTLALWRYNYNNIRPHSSLGNQTPAEARRALEQSEGSAPGALATPKIDHYQTQRLSL